MKEIWKFLKMIWPLAKPFICASKEEAQELREWAEEPIDDTTRMYPYALKELPAFVKRCIEELDK